MTIPRLSALGVALLVAACAGPKTDMQSAPPPELPATVAMPPVPADWWKGFGDPRLDALIEEALRENRDLARAMARIEESRAAVRFAQSESGPVVTAGVSATRQRVSENGPIALGRVSPWANDYRASLDISYEVDLFGRIASATRAAREDLLATEYARVTLRNSLVAQVVQAYAGLQSLDAQLLLFRRVVDEQREGVKLQRVRYDAGDLSELDIRQLEAELYANETQLPRLERALGEAERALALLLGRTPKALVEQGIARADPSQQLAMAAAIPEGLPSDLLLRRPDVAQAEARLSAAGARVDVARAAYFPSISLTAGAGVESLELSKLFDGPSRIFSILASLTQPIWAAGRLDANRDAELARQRQVELNYRDAVATAFKEVRDALGAHAEARATMINTDQRARALVRASELTNLRLEGGVASRLDAIETERLSLLVQAQALDARRAVSAAQADLFRALGGGWSRNDQISVR
jgi:multidrug efflux system outer membrane protein